MYYLADFKTKEKVTSDTLVFTGQEGPWEVVMDMEAVRSRINTAFFKAAPPIATKYLPLMPIRDYSNFVSLGEGATPLIRSTTLGKELGIDLYFKLENQNPTGAFKDRGSAVELTIAKEFNAKGIVVASTGNMAASCSCYAAAAHMPCFVFVPEDTPPSKLAQVISYGGKIVQVKGTYGDAAALAMKVADELGFYLAGDYAFRVEGHKTAAYEVAEQLFFKVPDMVVVPVGCGTNLASYYKGFAEYQELGFTESMPQIVGVQAAGAATIVPAFEQGLKDGIHLDRADSIARAIAINYALDGAKALDAIYATGGTAVALTDREMLEAQYRLSRDEGLFVETACAATVASLYKLAERSSLAGKKIVCVLTGSGLKDPNPILKIAIKPPSIYPTVDQFLKLYERSFFEGKNVTFVDRDEVAFSSEPSIEEIREQSFKIFRAQYAPEQLERIQAIMLKFIQKGKPVTYADFQDIVQEAMESFAKEQQAQVFSVLDFSVSTGQNRKAEATVLVQVNGDQRKASAEGVGPFDAIITALREACSDIRFALAGYKVDIRSQGTDAVVHVELKLTHESFVSVGTGTSPDIIQASVEAFEEAYNGLQQSED